MKYHASTPQEYIEQLPDDRQQPMAELRSTINQHLPMGYEETISYDMIGWVVPFSTYPAGYHCDPKLPLPFLNIASQKNFIALYHSGIYASPELKKWFVEEYPTHSKLKLDMGKCCIRFKNPKKIPFQLIAELVTKMSPQQWISIYEANVKK